MLNSRYRYSTKCPVHISPFRCYHMPAHRYHRSWYNCIQHLLRIIALTILQAIIHPQPRRSLLSATYPVKQLSINNHISSPAYLIFFPSTVQNIIWMSFTKE